MLHARSAKTTFALDEGNEKAADQVTQLDHPLDDASPRLGPPPLDHDFAIHGIERGDDPISGQRTQDLRLGRGTKDDLVRSGIEPADGCVHIADTAADPASRHAAELLDERTVVAPAKRGVQIDHRHITSQPKAFGNRSRIARIECLLLAANELHGVPVHQVDRGNDHRSSPVSARPNRQPLGQKLSLHFTHRRVAIVEDRSRQHGRRACAQSHRQMRRRGRST